MDTNVNKAMDLQSFTISGHLSDFSTAPPTPKEAQLSPVTIQSLPDELLVKILRQYVDDMCVIHVEGRIETKKIHIEKVLWFVTKAVTYKHTLTLRFTNVQWARLLLIDKRSNCLIRGILAFDSSQALLKNFIDNPSGIVFYISNVSDLSCHFDFSSILANIQHVALDVKEILQCSHGHHRNYEPHDDCLNDDIRTFLNNFQNMNSISLIASCPSLIHKLGVQFNRSPDIALATTTEAKGKIIADNTYWNQYLPLRNILRETETLASLLQSNWVRGNSSKPKYYTVPWVGTIGVPSNRN